MELNKKKLSAPKKDKIFKTYWNMFLPKMIDRENFHESHLKQLEILCDLYVDYHRLTNFIQENGYSFVTSGRYGETSRPHVETQVRIKTVGEIRAYSKLLGLILQKDIGNIEETSEWD